MTFLPLERTNDTISGTNPGSVNDTSSVTAAASTAESIYGVDGILSSAVTVKLTRTLAIIPITLVLALWRTAKAKKAGGSAENAFSFKKAFPFFIVWFVLAALVTTGVGLLPESGFVSFYGGSFVPAMKWLAKFFIAMAMAEITGREICFSCNSATGSPSS